MSSFSRKVLRIPNPLPRRNSSISDNPASFFFCCSLACLRRSIRCVCVSPKYRTTRPKSRNCFVMRNGVSSSLLLLVFPSWLLSPPFAEVCACLLLASFSAFLRFLRSFLRLFVASRSSASASASRSACLLRSFLTRRFSSRSLSSSSSSMRRMSLAFMYFFLVCCLALAKASFFRFISALSRSMVAAVLILILIRVVMLRRCVVL
mmetsp:Transcript_7231/g.19600  ORF Transcript_7231/g.19600 Transcript_7231/m.19600 type:complete len:206 (-) Transcript_7231:152-769(-)